MNDNQFSEAKDIYQGSALPNLVNFWDKLTKNLYGFLETLFARLDNENHEPSSTMSFIAEKLTQNDDNSNSTSCSHAQRKEPAPSSYKAYVSQSDDNSNSASCSYSEKKEPAPPSHEASVRQGLSKINKDLEKLDIDPLELSNSPH